VRCLREKIAEMSFSIRTGRAEKEICFLLWSKVVKFNLEQN